MNDLDVKNIRLKLNISQTELAEILGIHMRTVQNWESGGKIPVKIRRPLPERKKARD